MAVCTCPCGLAFAPARPPLCRPDVGYGRSGLSFASAFTNESIRPTVRAPVVLLRALFFSAAAAPRRGLIEYFVSQFMVYLVWLESLMLAPTLAALVTPTAEGKKMGYVRRPATRVRSSKTGASNQTHLSFSASTFAAVTEAC
jgi:hypothetical protein